MSPASWVRPPVLDTTSVRGGLELTANDPMKPEARLPAPSATRSRSKSSGEGVPLLAARTVAAVWTMQRNATVSAGPMRRRTSRHDAEGTPTEGSPPWMVPSTATPWSCNPSAAVTAVAITRPMSAPGTRRSMCSHATITTNTKTAMATSQPFT